MNSNVNSSNGCMANPLHSKAAGKRHQKRAKEDDFITPAERAFRRVAQQLRAEHAKLGLPLVVGENGRVRLVHVRTRGRHHG